MDIVIIGAGASGLVASIFAKSKDNNVTVLERYEKSGKKILVTGNGRCNYWNDDFDNKHFYSNDSEFIKEVNTLENQKKVLAFFESIGINPTIKNGYYYPMSKEASSVRNTLINVSMLKGNSIYVEANVKEIKKENNKFIITFNENEKIIADKVIIATGSNSYYKDENLGYKLCQSLGHNIIKVMPSLVQLIGVGDYFKDWAGVRENVKVGVYVNNQLQKEELGEIMLTDYGVSGICIFNLSGIANRALNENKKVEVKINFLPEINNLKEFLEERSTHVDDEIERFLEGIMNHKLIHTIVNKNRLVARKWSNLSEEEKNILVNDISNFKLEISGSKGFIDSQVCTGGVDTKEINPKTFESKKCDGLYIVGEILDVDGDCGGYNLGFAWLSGMIAGESVKND